MQSVSLSRIFVSAEPVHFCHVKQPLKDQLAITFVMLFRSQFMGSSPSKKTVYKGKLSSERNPVNTCVSSKGDREAPFSGAAVVNLTDRIFY